MAAAAQSPDVITVNLTATMFCDSSGASTLARAHRLATASGGSCGLPPAIRL
jgi:anti-anti-sigma regulatory factor